MTKKTELLEISTSEGLWKMTVKNPWQNADGTQITYYFSETPENDSCIRIPVQRVVCFSSSHVAFLSALGKTEHITGISGLKYICDTTVGRLAREGKIEDVGYEEQLNYEFFLRNKPDVALIYGVETEHARYIRRLEDLGVKVIYMAEYLEPHPLGRMEWIKAAGVLFNCYETADSIFTARCRTYDSLQTSVKGQAPCIVFSGSPIGDNWYVPGGRSYMSALIKDAGGRFALDENDKNESIPVPFETAYTVLLQSDVWINCDLPSGVIFSPGSRYMETNPVKKGSVYSNQANKGSGTGNDFWESAVVHPELLLMDMISIFHPNITGQKNPTYYQKVIPEP